MGLYHNKLIINLKYQKFKNLLHIANLLNIHGIAKPALQVFRTLHWPTIAQSLLTESLFYDKVPKMLHNLLKVY